MFWTILFCCLTALFIYRLVDGVNLRRDTFEDFTMTISKNLEDLWEDGFSGKVLVIVVLFWLIRLVIKHFTVFILVVGAIIALAALTSIVMLIVSAIKSGRIRRRAMLKRRCGDVMGIAVPAGSITPTNKRKAKKLCAEAEKHNAIQYGAREAARELADIRLDFFHSICVPAQASHLSNNYLNRLTRAEKTGNFNLLRTTEDEADVLAGKQTRIEIEIEEVSSKISRAGKLSGVQKRFRAAQRQDTTNFLGFERMGRLKQKTDTMRQCFSSQET